MAIENTDRSVEYCRRLFRLGTDLPNSVDLTHLAKGAGSITFRVDESNGVLPWELLSNLGSCLALRLPVLRQWPPVEENRRAMAKRNRRMVVVAPSAVADLPLLEEEVEAFEFHADERDLLIRTWRGNRMEIEELKQQIAESDLFYFGGHHLPCKGLQFDADRDVWYRAADLIDPERPPRLAWINACHSASLEEGGICRELLELGTPNVLGYNGPLHDAVGFEGMKMMLSWLLAGVSLEYALLRLRLYLAKSNNPAWPSFVLYGSGGPIFAPPAFDQDDPRLA